MKKNIGLGDTLEQILDAIKFSEIIKAINKDCGCKKRKEKLNKIFPYKKE